MSKSAHEDDPTKSKTDQPSLAQSSASSHFAEAATVTGASIAFVALLFVLRDFINPLLLAAAGTILLWPVREKPFARSVLIAGAFLILSWLLYTLGAVLVPFLIAYILAYMMNPLATEVVERFNIKRWIPALVITIVSIALVALLFILVVPQIVTELDSLSSRLFAQMNQVRDSMNASTILDRLESAGLVERETFVSGITTMIQNQATALANSIPNTIQSLLKSISGVLQLVTLTAVMPVLIYYTLKDYETVRNRIIELFPTVRGDREYLAKAGAVVGNYLRGQLLISAIAMCLVSTALVIFNVPFALLIGILAGIMNMIPNIGIVITNVIGVLIAVVFGDPWLLKAVIVLAVLGLESVLEQTVLVPRIQSNQVGLHPILIIMSLFVFGSLMGLVGLLIAVPATAILVTSYSAWKDDLTLEIAKPAPRKTSKRRFRRGKGDGS